MLPCTHGERADTLQIPHNVPASVFTFHRFYSSSTHCNNNFFSFFFSFSFIYFFSLEIHSRCSTVKDARQEKKNSSNPAHLQPASPFPTEDKTILLIIAYIKIFTSTEAPPGVLPSGLTVPYIPSIKGQARSGVSCFSRHGTQRNRKTTVSLFRASLNIASKDLVNFPQAAASENFPLGWFISSKQLSGHQLLKHLWKGPTWFSLFTVGFP